MKNKPNIKKIISKKIEFTQKNRTEKPVLNEKINTKKIEVTQKNKIEKIINKNKKNSFVRIEYQIKNKTVPQTILNTRYVKRTAVDCDVVICITSYDRFDKVSRLIGQFNDQESKYSFKIVLLNDGSGDPRYDTIEINYPNIIYLKNETPNGKINHWYCYNQMWEQLKNIKSHCVLQTDDDFILCDGFIDRILDLYFSKKNVNSKYVAIAPHLWSFEKVKEDEGWWRTNHIDGIALLDIDLIKNMGYKMKSVDAAIVIKKAQPVRTWSQILNAINNMNGLVYRTEVSLAYHDGNDDSKLHGDVRKDGKGGIYTQKFIGKL